jgi:hypothetical protein
VTDRISFPSYFRWALRFAMMVCMAGCVAALTMRQAQAQAVPAATWPTGDTSTADQPLPGQLLGIELSLNQGISAITGENVSFDHFGLGFSASGGAETNFLGTQTNETTAGYGQFGIQAGLLLRSDRSRYFALYQPEYNIYPQYSEINNFAQRFYQTVTHEITERSGVAWDTTAARYLSLNQYLPQSLNIGGVGIVIPTLGAQLREDSFEITNAATTIRYRYLLSTRMTFTSSLTGGIFILIPSHVTGAGPRFTERYVTTGGDLGLDYVLTPRNAVGVEVTPIYIDGLTPGGHEVAETVQAIYQRQLGATWTARGGIGPLFIQASSPLYGNLHETSYAANASLSHSIRQSQLSVAYRRSFLVSLLSPGVAGNSVGFSAYLPIGNRWIFAGAATYAEDRGNATLGASNVFGGSGQFAYQIEPRWQIFALYSVLSSHYSFTPTQSSGYTRNKIGAGIRFNLGNPITSGGLQ